MPGVALPHRTLAELLDQIAAREPAPGGGSAAALTAAAAAALVEMAVAFAPPAAARSDRGARAAAARAQLLELAEADLRSYEPVLAARRMHRDQPGRAAAVQAALSDATEVPLAIATAATDVAELGAAAAKAGRPQLIGDATAAVLLAKAASRTAARLVELNLANAPADPRLRIAAEAAGRAWAARGAVGAFPPSTPG